VEGQKITNSDQIRTIVAANLGKEITIVYRRGEIETTTRATPRTNPPEGEGALGIYMGNPVFQVPWWQTIPYSIREVGFQAEALIHLPGRLLRGEVSGDEARVVGIVGMGRIYNEIPSLILRLAFIATISTALGLTNLLPLPALDGGRILFVLPELLFRRRVPQQYENAVHLIGFATLIILMIFITAQDIINPIQF
jgi:regulator of sigma E protease